MSRTGPSRLRRLIRPDTPGNAVLLLLVGFVLGILVMSWLGPRAPRTVSPDHPADVRVLLSDRFLARQVTHDARRMGISHVTVRSAPPSRLVADARWASPVGTVAVQVVAQPIASAGRLRLAILSAQLAGVTIPSSVAQAIVNSFAGSLARPLGKSARIVSVRVVRQGVRLSANYSTP